MLRFNTKHPFACSADRFWELFFDPEFTRSMILGGLGFHECEVEPVSEANGFRHRRLSARPRLELPSLVANLIGPRFRFSEEGRFDLASKTWSWDTRPATLADRVFMGGMMRVHDTPAGCSREAELWVDTRIFAIGGLVERAARRNIEGGWNRSAVWIAEQL